MKALLLLSGGIDSAVAGEIMNKRLEIVAIHFDNNPFGGSGERERSIKLCEKIGVKKLYIANHGKFQQAVIYNCNRRFQCVMCKRMMFRVASSLGEKEKIDFLLTGENLAQVASQTLENMKVTDEVTKLPILRPLLCYDKNEVISIAREIGTYEISILPGEGCLAVPINPATKSNLEIIKKEEFKIDIEALIKHAVDTVETKEF